ncbi:MAG: GLUG motif-containing protein, partial [Pygmaiobacter sp.]|nr:GLUG motif-containing protein [Pygmaiobacter sp.]
MISTQTNAKKTRGRVGIAAISTLVIMCSMLTACGGTTKMNSDFAGGDGSVSSPYQIETAEQLDKVREHLDSSFILESDIDLSSYDNWSPIGTFESLSDKPEDAEVPNPEVAFTGNFDGNGHMISHVTVNEPQSMAVGLFGCVAGTETAPTSIKNLKVSDVSITGGYLVGGAAGLQFTYCTIENVSLEGKNALQGCQGVGGVVGTGFSLIKDCTATADITVLGDDGASAGIVVGGATYSSITGCTASGGSISAEGNACWGIGSICGAPYASSEITDCSAHNITISATG